MTSPCLARLTASSSGWFVGLERPQLQPADEPLLGERDELVAEATTHPQADFLTVPYAAASLGAEKDAAESLLKTLRGYAG